jgi:Cyclophilin type peptidyl-prolyl cis-trans isomerase/CLD
MRLLTLEWSVHISWLLFASIFLPGKHVVFGKVISGREVLQQFAMIPVDDKDRPTTPVVISNCGELELRLIKQPDIPNGNFCLMLY